MAEVLVVDDGSGDATAAEAARAGARSSRPRPATRRGRKAAACAHGARLATAGRWLARRRRRDPGPEALSRLLAVCLAGGVAAASPLARQATRTWWEALPARPGPAGGRAARPAAVADPGRAAAFLSGQCLLVRRDAYEAVGGFRAVAGSLVEDVPWPAQGGRPPPQGPPRPGLAAVRMYGRFGDLWAGLAKAWPWSGGPGRPRWPGRRPGRRPGGRPGWLYPARGAAARHGRRRPARADRPGRWPAGRRGRPALAAAYPLADLVLLAVYADSVRRHRTGAPFHRRGAHHRPPPGTTEL